MPRRKVAFRSVPVPPRNTMLRSVPSPLRSKTRPSSSAKPKKTIAKKQTKLKLSDLSDALITRILDLCNAKEILRGRCLSTVRQAYSLAMTCTRYMALFRNRLHAVDATFPASRGYPSSCHPRYISPTQMTWIARLAQGRLRHLRLPTYKQGTTNILVAVEYCCHQMQDLAFTDKGSVFPNLACSLFTMCSMMSRIEIRAPQRSTIQAMQLSKSDYREIILIDVPADCLEVLCKLIEEKGEALKVLQIAFDIDIKEDMLHGLTEKNEVAYSKVQMFGDYIKEHGLEELPNVEVLDISTSPYYIVDHDAWDILDDADHPVHALKKNLKLELGKVKSLSKQREAEGRKIRKIRMMRIRSANIEFVENMTICHLPLNRAKMLEVTFPGGSLLFDTNDEKRPKITSLQLGMHLNDGDACITKEARDIKTIDLGTHEFVRSYHYNNDGIQAKVAKLMLYESGSIKTIRGVFNLGCNPDWISKVYVYIARVMKFAMLATTLEITYEMIQYGHGVHKDFREMIYSWRKLQMLRLMNPTNYGHESEGLTESDCMAFVSGLQWLLELLPKTCADLRVIYCEDLGDIAEWKNGPMSMTTLKWAVEAVEDFAERWPVDCGTLTALLKRWLADCQH